MKEHLLSGCSWFFHSAILTQNSRGKKYLTALLVPIFYVFIFLIPYKTQHRPLWFEPFEWRVVVKILLFYVWKHYLAKLDVCWLLLVIVIVYHLKSICRTLCVCFTYSIWILAIAVKRNRLTFSILIRVNLFWEVFDMVREKAKF